MNNYRIRIFSKDNNYGIVVIDYFEDTNLVGVFDGRHQRGKLNRFDDLYEANEKYTKAINQTTERGWELVYTGERNEG